MMNSTRMGAIANEVGGPYTKAKSSSVTTAGLRAALTPEQIFSLRRAVAYFLAKEESKA